MAVTDKTKVPILDINTAVEKGIEGKSGKVYTFNSELSVDRFEFQDILAERMQFGYGPADVDRKLREVYNLFNGAKFADGSVKLSALMNAKDQMHTRSRAVMKIVALYFNAEDEDPMTVNEKVIEDKVNDWTHYSYTSFFVLATSFVNLRHRKLEESLAQSSELVAQMIAKDRSERK
jgi:hypothetical protein